MRTSQSPIGKSKNSKCNDDAKDTTCYLLNQNKTNNQYGKEGYKIL